MTVKELIDTLNEVEDKNLEVMFYHDGVGYQYINTVYYGKCYCDSNVVVIEDSKQSSNIIDNSCYIGGSIW